MATIKIMMEMLESISSMFSWKDSSMYEHMTFKDIEPSFVEELRKNLKNSFADEETFGFLHDNPDWKHIIE